jgi:hypothetical protein
MSPPISVRLGILSQGIGLAGILLAIALSAPQLPRAVVAAALPILLSAGLLYAMSRGHNLARLFTLFCYSAGLPFGLYWTLRAGTTTRQFVPALIWDLFIGAGVACLFSPTASAWYHPQRGKLSRSSSEMLSANDR